MRNPKIILSLVLGAGLLAGGITLAPSLAEESRTASTAARQWLSIGQVHQKLEAAGFRNVEKIEREHGVYEARATDRNGARVKLYINPQTGEVTDRTDRSERRKYGRDGRDGAHGEGRQREGAASASNSVECNQRRCRDDVPHSAAVTQPASK
jgi:hypothetical protein